MPMSRRAGGTWDTSLPFTVTDPLSAVSKPAGIVGGQRAAEQSLIPSPAAQRSWSIGFPRWKIIPLMLLEPPGTLPRAC